MDTAKLNQMQPSQRTNQGWGSSERRRELLQSLPINFLLEKEQPIFIFFLLPPTPVPTIKQSRKCKQPWQKKCTDRRRCYGSVSFLQFSIFPDWHQEQDLTLWLMPQKTTWTVTCPTKQSWHLLWGQTGLTAQRNCHRYNFYWCC